MALKNALNAIKLSPTGVFVQASTLGSMEALLEYLRSVKVPVSTKKVFHVFSFVLSSFLLMLLWLRLWGWGLWLGFWG